MAPNYPEEVDVFSVPHSRMKQLVHKYLDLVSSTNFYDVNHMTSVLEKLCHTFHMFKAHEQIENHFIMRRLKEKLTALDITDAAVCNCHSDNRLAEMLSMVLDGYRWAQRSQRDRVKYRLKLKKALEDFTQDFLPHMKEEEEVFQPMLIEYFTYDELKELKAKVIQQHREKVEEEVADEKCMPECDSDKEEVEEEEEEEWEEVAANLAEQVPTEVMLKILSYLSPRDLSRCAQVSQHWNQLAMDPSLWQAMRPVQWVAGNWSFHPSVEEEVEAEETHLREEEEDYFYLDDEDADRDESSDSESSECQADASLQQAMREVRVISGLVKHVLPRVGSGVEQCDLSHSRSLSSSLVHKILKLCPNLRHLNLAHTRITDAAFKEYGMKGGTCQLERLDLSACENITDLTLHSLAGSHPTRAQGPRFDGAVSCRGRGKGSCAVPSVMVDFSVSEHDCDYASLGKDSLIDQDPSLTDLPLELCNLDCMDICLERAPVSGVRKADSGGPGNGYAADIFSSCCVKRTCSSSESGEARTGCCGKGGVELRSCCEQRAGKKASVEGPHALHRLTHLSLNGCFRISDDGLRVLAERGGLPQLRHLDLSGCLSLTGEGLALLVGTCPLLDHAALFYCDNVCPDPFPATASGCRNLECGMRYCCRFGN